MCPDSRHLQHRERPPRSLILQMVQPFRTSPLLITTFPMMNGKLITAIRESQYPRRTIPSSKSYCLARPAAISEDRHLWVLPSESVIYSLSKTRLPLATSRSKMVVWLTLLRQLPSTMMYRRSPAGCFGFWLLQTFRTYHVRFLLMLLLTASNMIKILFK